jgi:hypothetical protein
VDSGGRTNLQPRSLKNDGRSATIVVTLPVRFRGGALLICDPDGREEKYFGRGEKNGDIEWIALLPDCDYEIETVQKGCLISISRAVFLGTPGLSGSETNSDPLINTSDDFLDFITLILDMSRGRKTAFFLILSIYPKRLLSR